eukprot:7971448-Alexandrium_andersonii.AAC.1
MPNAKGHRGQHLEPRTHSQRRRSVHAHFARAGALVLPLGAALEPGSCASYDARGVPLVLSLGTALEPWCQRSLRRRGSLEPSVFGGSLGTADLDARLEPSHNGGNTCESACVCVRRRRVPPRT